MMLQRGRSGMPVICRHSGNPY